MSKRDEPSSVARPVSRPGKRRKKSTEGNGLAELDEAWMMKHRLPFRDADVAYAPDFVDALQAQRWLQDLKELPDWFQPTLKMYGRSFKQSRKIIAYATEPFELKYSGQSLSMLTEWPPAVLEAKEMAEQQLGCSFNHCMLNMYEDGSVHIGAHRDNAENNIIAAISLNAPDSERDFIMKHDRHIKGIDVDAEGQVMRKRWKLQNGSLLLMTGATQANWKHEIPKQQKIKGPRISLTFRQMVFD